MTDRLRGTLKQILEQSHAPKSTSQIRKELTGPFRLSAKDLSALLDEMTAAAEIFPWPQKKFWDRDPRIALPGLVLSIMTESRVASASRLKTSLRLPIETVETTLNDLVAEGRLYLWQPGKTPYFCVSEPGKTAVETVLNALAAGPLAEKELIGLVRKRLPGYRTKDLREHLSHSKQVYEHPKYGKARVKYGLEPPEPGPYLDKAVQEIRAVQRLLAPFHMSLDDIHQALGRELELEPESRVTPRERSHEETDSRDTGPMILEGIARLQPPGQRRALVSIRELRRSVELSKIVFDKAVLSLALQGKVALHHHDFPSGLSLEERDELVRDEQGTYYVGIVPKVAP